MASDVGIDPAPSGNNPDGLAGGPVGGRFAMLLGALSALVPLAVDMYLPCFDAMGHTFDATPGEVGWSLSSFFVGMFIGQLTWGPISDRYGRKKPLLWGLGGYVVASIGCAMAPTLAVLVACRALQACAGCAGMVLSRAMVRDCFVRQQAVRMLSLLMLVQGLAPMIGPTLGGAVQSAAGWRAVFVILAAMGVLLWLVTALRVPETNRRQNRTLSVTSAVRQYGELVGERAFLRYALSGSVVSAGMFAYITCSPFVYMDLLHLSPNVYALVFAGNAIGITAAGQINRVLAARIGLDKTLRFAFGMGCLASLAIYASCAWRFVPAVFVPALSVYLASLGFVWPNVSAGALAQQGHRAGTAAATHGAIHWGFACVASALSGQWADDTARPMAGIICGASVLGAMVFWRLSPRGQRGV